MRGPWEVMEHQARQIRQLQKENYGLRLKVRRRDERIQRLYASLRAALRGAS